MSDLFRVLILAPWSKFRVGEIVEMSAELAESGLSCGDGPLCELVDEIEPKPEQTESDGEIDGLTDDRTELRAMLEEMGEPKPGGLSVRHHFENNSTRRLNNATRTTGYRLAADRSTGDDEQRNGYGKH